MTTARSARLLALLTIGSLAAVFATSAVAQPGAEAWKKRIAIYGWLPDISGKTRFPAGGSGPDIEVDAGTIVSNLNFTLMGAIDLRKGKWGMFSDVLYMDLGDTSSDTRDFTLGSTPIPGDVTLDTRFDLKSWVWTLGATYALVDSGTNLTQLLLGARMLDMDQSLGFTFNGDIGSLPLPGRSGTAVVDATNWDAIVGIKGHVFLGGQQKWFLPYHADIGTGDSDLTWQAMTGIGYSFSWGETVLSWRYLEYDMDDIPIQEIDFSGPMLGASFAW